MNLIPTNMLASQIRICNTSQHDPTASTPSRAHTLKAIVDSFRLALTSGSYPAAERLWIIDLFHNSASGRFSYTLNRRDTLRNAIWALPT